MKSKPIPYSGAKTINKNLTFMNASKEPALGQEQNALLFDVSHLLCSNSWG